MATSTRLTISIPAALAEKLDRVKGRIVVSNVCAEALERHVDACLALADQPALGSAIARLRAERLAETDDLVERAYAAGWRWVVEEATWPDLRDLFERIDDNGNVEATAIFYALEDVTVAHAAIGRPSDGSLEHRLMSRFLSATACEALSLMEKPYFAFLRGLQDAWGAVKTEVLRD